MGWFWADLSKNYGEEPVNLVSSPARDERIGGTLWAPKADIWASPEREEVKPEISGCPIDHSRSNWASSKLPVSPTGLEMPNSESSGCPVKHEPKSACPVDHTKYSKMNNIPNLVAAKLPGQKLDLPLDRTRSSIPRGEQSREGFWEYPSPQQMLNAMVRKSGRDGIDEDAVESMVDVHNYLNEGVWQEVLEWEKPYTSQSETTPRLLKFQGRPGDISPRARMLQMLGWVYPSKFGVPPPFDRHDWTVLRAAPDKKGDWQQIRYVIDFYEIPDENDEVPVFTVDVRPAADSLSSIYDRARKAWGPLFEKALGQ